MSRPNVLALAWIALVTPPASAQWNETKWTAGTPVAGESYGWSVDVSGETAAIGAPWDSGGKVRVLDRNQGGPGAWGEVKSLSSGLGYGAFGWDLTLTGDLLVVGAAFEQAVYIYERDEGGPGAWGQVGKITPPQACCLMWTHADGETVAVGLPYAAGTLNSPGRVYVYDRNAGGPDNWGQVATLIPADIESNTSFGMSVAVQGDTVVGGGIGGTGPSESAAFVFERDFGGPGAWGEVQKLQGDEIFNSDYGQAADLRGDTLVIGAPYEGAGGVAYVYYRDGSGLWSEVAKLSLTGTPAGAQFGATLAVRADQQAIVVGAPHWDSPASRAGGAALFERHFGGLDAWGGTETFVTLDADAGDAMGLSVALQYGEVLAGAPSDDEAGADAGAAYLFAQSAPPDAYCTAGASASGCVATISASGTPSATDPSGFFLTAVGTEGGVNGMFFFGPNGRQANPWGNGTSFQCVVPPVWRGGPLPGIGSAGSCDGAFSQDLNARWTQKPHQNPGAAAVVQAQTWYRDPLSTSNRTTSLSDAIEFQVSP